MENYSALKRCYLSRHEKIWKKLECMLLSESSQFKNTTYFVISTIFWKRKAMDMLKKKKISGCLRLMGGGRMNSKAWRIFKAVKIPRMTSSWWIPVIIHFFKPTHCTILSVKRGVNHGLWVIMMCQCRSSVLTNALLWWEMLVVGQAMHVRGGAMWELSVPSSQFCCKPKTDLK